jgi:uncharacterized protein (TIGR02611 family)
MSGDSLVERLRAQRERHLERPAIVRVGWVIGGFTLLFAGVMMLVLPGPALLVIPVALAILSLEFAWAARWLEKALVQAEKARESARRTSRGERVAMGAAVVLALGALVVAAVLWDIPLLPV